MIENVAAQMPRLDRLRVQTNRMVSMAFQVTIYRGGNSEAAWEVYDGTETHTGPTLEAALLTAEQAHGLAPVGVPTAIETPDK